jgi:hypothetical protein
MIILGYVDPGLGALIWQTIAAACIGFVFYLRQTRRWIVRVFTRLSRQTPEAPPQSVEVGPSAKSESELDRS